MKEMAGYWSENMDVRRLILPLGQYDTPEQLIGALNQLFTSHRVSYGVETRNISQSEHFEGCRLFISCYHPKGHSDNLNSDTTGT